MSENCPLCGHPVARHPDRTCTASLNERSGEGCLDCEAMWLALDRALRDPVPPGVVEAAKEVFTPVTRRNP